MNIQRHNIYENIKDLGYYQIYNDKLSNNFYKSLYEDYDEIVTLIRNDNKFIEYNKKIENNYINFSENIFFANYSIGFNCLKPISRNIKTYFHFSEDYYLYIKKFHNILLHEYKVFNKFLDKQQLIYKVANKYFAEAIKELNKIFPNLENIMYPKNRKLIIYIKTCLHQATDRIAENQHFDWSGFTIIFHNDDENIHRLKIAPYNESGNYIYTAFIKQFVKIKGQFFTYPIVFPGHPLQKILIGLNPTPHYVERINSNRHSLLAFCMVPGIKCNFIGA
jgi:hypothetical protein